MIFKHWKSFKYSLSAIRCTIMISCVNIKYFGNPPDDYKEVPVETKQNVN